MSGHWGVSGRPPVDADFRAEPWHPLVRGLPDRAAGEAWLREHGPGMPDLVHFSVHAGPAVGTTGKPELREHWYREPERGIVSGRDGRGL